MVWSREFSGYYGDRCLVSVISFFRVANTWILIIITVVIFVSSNMSFAATVELMMISFSRQSNRGHDMTNCSRSHVR